jgi:Uncharacterised nucleotidyltransferase
MHQRAAQNWVTQELALRIAEIAISTLERSGIRALPVKGVLLARQVYDPASRPIADVDLAIEPVDLRRALRVARASNWRVVWDTKVTGSVNFVVEGFAVDVKTSVGPPGISATGVRELFARSTFSNEPLGFPHWQIEQHDHALLLAIDAFKDGLGTGKPWAREDLVRIGAVNGFSASTLVERAAAARLQTMLAIVADWVLSSGASSTWTSVLEALRSLSLRSAYRERYRRLLERKARSALGRWYLSAVTRTVSDSPRQRAIALGLAAVGTAQYVARYGGLNVNPWKLGEGS